LLKGFEAAARLLSFTKAADELHLTQSAVSRQIQDLEQQLGVPLFQRRHRSLVLTDAGQQLFSAAAQVLATMRAVTDRVRASSGARRVLSVTTMASFASLWLVPRLAGFARDHPDVDVRIATEPRMQDLEREADVAIRYCTEISRDPTPCTCSASAASRSAAPRSRRIQKRPLPTCRPAQPRAAPVRRPGRLCAMAELEELARASAWRTAARGEHSPSRIRAHHSDGDRGWAWRSAAVRWCAG
jgi:DNA-binding transcriptional LysR family regulator